MSRVEIFTPKQRMVMAKNMQPWLEDMFKKAAPNDFQKRLESLSVRYVPLAEYRRQFSRNSLWAQLVQDGCIKRGDFFKVLVMSKENDIPDLKYMAQQIHSVKLEYLGSHPGRQAYKNKGGATNIKEAKRLVEDALDDNPYKYEAVTKFRWGQFSSLPAEAIGIHGSYVIWGSVKIDGDILTLSVFSTTAIKNMKEGPSLYWNFAASLYDGDEKIARKGIGNKGSQHIYDHDRSEHIGDVEFTLPIADPKHSLRLDVGGGLTVGTGHGHAASPITLNRSIAIKVVLKNKGSFIESP